MPDRKMPTDFKFCYVIFLLIQEAIFSTIVVRRNNLNFFSTYLNGHIKTKNILLTNLKSTRGRLLFQLGNKV